MSGPRVLLLGAAGQVGRELQRSFAGFGELLASDRRTVDLADAGRLRSAVHNAAPDLILNGAAYTAVDRAESERDLAMAINDVAPGVLAEEAEKLGAVLVHYSTDYVFDGSKTSPWVESDPTNPLNVYGASKLAGEQAIAQACSRHLIFRTSWVYGPHGKNFLLTMLRLGRERERLSVVDDQVGAPTTSIALADATRAAVEAIFPSRLGESGRWAGIYHMTCSGATSWYGFAKAIFARTGSKNGSRTPEIVPIPSSGYPTPAQRPHNSVLSNEKLQRTFSIQLPHWENALDTALLQLESQ